MASRLVLDSNLLVLLVVGLASRKYISKHKRLESYNESDFDLLKQIISEAQQILVTPNTLTQASDLALQTKVEPARTHIALILKRLIDTNDELYVDSKGAAGRHEFVKLGLTDSVMLELAQGGASLLTADSELYQAAIAKRYVARNFNHLREANWG